jgi:DNA-binding MarR family transcriptional regulator
METSRYGFELPLLLIGAFRNIIDELHQHLNTHGHQDSRPLHAFVLQAIGSDVVSVTELARRLGVTRQAAAKTVARLEQLGYAERNTDPKDARASLIAATAHASDLLRLSAVFFEAKKREWAALLGEPQFENLLGDLSKLTQGGLLGDLPGWFARA